MYLIKICPSCNTKLRFPLDKGKIEVKCRCGYKFIADPDNTDMYAESEFDIASGRKRNPLSLIKINIESFLKNISFKKIYTNITKSILSFKYKIQNFKLLPNEEKRRIIIVFVFFLIIMLIVFLLNSLSKTVIEEGIVFNSNYKYL